MFEGKKYYLESKKLLRPSSILKYKHTKYNQPEQTLSFNSDRGQLLLY